jgi:hypothetical protein
MALLPLPGGVLEVLGDESLNWPHFLIVLKQFIMRFNVKNLDKFRALLT